MKHREVFDLSTMKASKRRLGMIKFKYDSKILCKAVLLKLNLLCNQVPYHDDHNNHNHFNHSWTSN